MRWSHTALVLGFFIVQLSCSPQAPAEKNEDLLKVHVAGCAELRAGPICRPPSDGRITLWVEPGSGRPIIGPPGVESSRQIIDHGLRLDLVIPPRLDVIELRLGTASGPSVYALKIDRNRSPILRAAEAQFAAAHYAEVLHILDVDSLSPADTAWAYALRAKVGFRTHQPAALADNIRAAEAAEKAGVTSLAIEKFAAAIYLYLHAQDFSAARSILQRMRQITPDDGLAQVYVAYGEASLSLETNNLRAATNAMKVIDRWTRRFSMSARFMYGVEAMRMELFTKIGQPERALSLGLSILKREEQTTPCLRAALLANMGWVASKIERGGNKLAVDLVALMQTELSSLSDSDCESVNYLRLNLVELMLLRGKAAEAAPHLSSLSGDLRLKVWRDVALGRMALIQKHPAKALGAFERAIEQDGSLMSREVRRQAVLGQAEALAALGRTDEAAEAFAQAEALIDSQSLLVPIGGALHGFIGDRERGSRAYISFLVAQNQPAKALQVARRARARVLMRLRQQNLVAELTPAAQKSWDEALKAYRTARAELDQRTRTDRLLPADEQPAAAAARKALEADAQSALDKAYHALGDHRSPDPRPPVEGELLLAYVQGADRWFGFAATTSGVLSVPLEFGPEIKTDAQLSAALLEPFRAQITASRVLTFLPQGRTRRVDFHALPWNDGALAQSVPVQYGLDLAPIHAHRPGRRALLISDPLGDLQASREEAKIVQSASTSRLKLTVKHLTGRAATLAAVRAQLPGSQLFHFAGHGVHGGAAGWGSELRLSGETRLTVGDVLTLKSAPEVVVLSACEGGASEATGEAEALGLAQAFVVAGSRAVIAATREVDSALASRLSAALYDQDDFPANPAAALKGAITTLRAKTPSADWATFRVIVP